MGGTIGITHIKMLPLLLFFYCNDLFLLLLAWLLLLAPLFLLDFILVLCMGGVLSFQSGLFARGRGLHRTNSKTGVPFVSRLA